MATQNAIERERNRSRDQLYGGEPSARDRLVGRLRDRPRRHHSRHRHRAGHGHGAGGIVDPVITVSSRSPGWLLCLFLAELAAMMPDRTGGSPAYAYPAYQDRWPRSEAHQRLHGLGLLARLVPGGAAEYDPGFPTISPTRFGLDTTSGLHADPHLHRLLDARASPSSASCCSSSPAYLGIRFGAVPRDDPGAAVDDPAHLHRRHLDLQPVGREFRRAGRICAPGRLQLLQPPPRSRRGLQLDTGLHRLRGSS